MRKLAFTFRLAGRLLFPRRSAQRVVACMCVLGMALGLMLQILVRGVMDGMILEIERGVQVILPDFIVEDIAGGAEGVRGIAGIRKVTECRMGAAASSHGLCRFSTWAAEAMPAELLVAGSASPAGGQCLVSRSFAEKTGLAPGDKFVLHLPESACCLKVGGIYRVPGRMLSPDVLLPHSSSCGADSLAVQLEPGADAQAFVAAVRRRAPKAQIHPANGDTQAWLAIIARAKQTMGFILYFCTLLSAFACGALFWVICLQHRQQFAVLFAMGMSPSRMRGLVLMMAGMIACTGLALGIPLAVFSLAQRESIRLAFSAIGFDAFPVHALDMELPAHATPQLYIIHSLISLAFVFLAAMPTFLSLPRIAAKLPGK